MKVDSSTLMDGVLAILAGLVLFLYAVVNLSSTVQEILGDRAREVILRFTSNLFVAIVTGTMVTMLLDSSSAVIILSIVLVNGSLLTFRQSMGIVLGANIGTTFSSQIIALDVAKFSPVLLLIGFAMMLISRSERVNSIGKVILLFGVLFFGLFTMENAVEPMRDDPRLHAWLLKADQPVYGALMGALITLIIQSSSATVGIAIILSKKGLLSLSGGVAVMLGAELGTCSDTLLATIKGSRQALRTGVFHLLFNLITIILGLLLFRPFLSLVNLISSGAHVEHAIANSHMIFNISGVLIFVWFVPLFERFLTRVIPDKN